MRGGDARSRRIAILSDSLLNSELGVVSILAERGWGVMQLPPAELGEADAAAWIENLADQVVEFRRHDYAVVAILAAADPDARTGLERALDPAACAALPSLEVEEGGSEAVRQFLDGVARLTPAP